MIGTPVRRRGGVVRGLGRAGAACVLALLLTGCHGSPRAAAVAPAGDGAARAHQTQPLFEIAPAEPPPIPRGIVVWMSPSDSGAPPRDWVPVLEQHGLIWIGANRSGNQVAPRVRLARAVQARREAAWRWQHVEGMRTVVAGFSGGARIASELLVAAPDLFAGAILMAGADCWRFVPSTDPRWELWPPAFRAPPAERLRLARTRPVVFLVGARDALRPRVRDMHAAWREDGFQRAMLREVPSLGHEPPPARAFSRALADVGLAP